MVHVAPSEHLSRLTSKEDFQAFRQQAHDRWDQMWNGDKIVASVGVGSSSIAKGALEVLDRARQELGGEGIVREVSGNGAFWMEPWIEVKRPGVPVAPIVLVAMNGRAIAPRDAPIVAKPVETAEVGRELAWRVGRIAFHGETLGEAAAEFARYSDVRIQIDDPGIADQRVTGLFVSTVPIGFANAVAVSFDLRSEISGGQVRLVRQ